MGLSRYQPVYRDSGLPTASWKKGDFLPIPQSLTSKTLKKCSCALLPKCRSVSIMHLHLLLLLIRRWIQWLNRTLLSDFISREHSLLRAANRGCTCSTCHHYHNLCSHCISTSITHFPTLKFKVVVTKVKSKAGSYLYHRKVWNTENSRASEWLGNADIMYCAPITTTN